MGCGRAQRGLVAPYLVALYARLGINRIPSHVACMHVYDEVLEKRHTCCASFLMRHQR